MWMEDNEGGLGDVDGMWMESMKNGKVDAALFPLQPLYWLFTHPPNRMTQQLRPAQFPSYKLQVISNDYYYYYCSFLLLSLIVKSESSLKLGFGYMVGRVVYPWLHDIDLRLRWL